MSETEAMFPVLESARELAGKDFPRAIPWRLVAPYEARAQKNHYQTLQRLSERGGLSWSELELVLTDRAWDGRVFYLPRDREAYQQYERAAAERVRRLIAERAAN